MLRSVPEPVELEALSRIVNLTSPASDIGAQLDRFTARAGEVVPFSRCVLLHERRGASMSRGLVYRRCADGGAGADIGSGRVSFWAKVDIGRYVESLATSDRVDHAFRWRLAEGSPAARLQPWNIELVDHMRGGEGIAAHFHSVVSATEEVETLLQLRCDRAEISEHQTLLLSFIAFHLHSTFALNHFDSQPPGDVADVKLTGREKDVLRWVIEGKTSWEIGKILSTSERTVKFHLKNIYAKLKVSNRAQAAALGNRLRLI